MSSAKWRLFRLGLNEFNGFLIALNNGQSSHIGANIFWHIMASLGHNVLICLGCIPASLLQIMAGIEQI